MADGVMAEGEPRSEWPAALAEAEVSELTTKLAEASFTLLSWYSSRDSDSVRIQVQRKRDYALACEILEALPSQAQWYL